MKHLLSNGSESLIERFAWSNVLLAFDFDGTLAPIVDKPGEARMRASTRKLLGAVAERYPCAIVSGRSAADVRQRMVGVPVTTIVGNHGLEPSPNMERFARAVDAWRPVLERELGALQGIELEDKKYSIAIHYRRSRNKQRARGAISATVARLSSTPRVIAGKQVVNLVPTGAPHKGIAVEHWRRRLGLDTALYVGDDITDEDVFALDQPGQLLSIRIGTSATSSAPYYLRNQLEIDVLLARLVSLREAPPARTTRRQQPASRVTTAPSTSTEPELPTLDPSLEFLATIWELNHALETASRKLKTTHGVTGQQRMVLRIVGKFPGISAGQLAALLRVHPGTLSPTLARLSRRGLLSRQQDSRDKRRAVLGLTAKGHALATPRAGTVEEAVTRLLQRTPRESVEHMRATLGSLITALT